MTEIPAWVPAVLVSLLVALLGLAVLWGRTLSQLTSVRESLAHVDARLSNVGEKLEKIVAHEEKIIALEKEIDRLSRHLITSAPHKAV